MKILPNLLAIGWSLLVLGSFYLGYRTPAGANSALRAAARIEVFLLWQGTALALALIAAGLSLGRHDRRGSKGWWMGWGPLLGNVVIGAVVGLAVAVSRLL